MIAPLVVPVPALPVRVIFPSTEVIFLAIVSPVLPFPTVPPVPVTEIVPPSAVERRVSNFTPRLLSAPVNDSGGALAEKLEYEFKFDIVDLDMGRPCYFGTRLIVNPYVGGRLMFQTEELETSLTMNTNGATPPTTPILFPMSTKARNHSWKLGPRIGVDSSWLLGAGFRFMGDGAFSLLYVHATNRQKIFGDIVHFPQVPGILAEFTHGKRNALGLNFDLDVGLGWGTYFNCHKERIDFSVKYQFLAFMNGDFNGNAGNLILNGLTVTGRFDF